MRSDPTPGRWEKVRVNLLNIQWQEVWGVEEDRIVRTQAAAREAGLEFEL